MALTLRTPEFIIERNDDRCIACQVCVRQCANDIHAYDADDDCVYSDETDCVGCHRCVTLCPTHALTIRENPLDFRPNSNWSAQRITSIYKQAETGGILLSGMGCDQPQPIYFDHLLLNASQVTNPSIDPLREPMELRTYLGRKPDRVEVMQGADGVQIETQLAPQLTLETPIMFSAMSYGSISYNACLSLARAARESGILYNTGEGGLHPSLYEYGPYTIAQVASGRFGVHPEYLEVAAALEIKIGQGAKPGIGGHLPGEKVSAEVSRTRMIPEGTDALSPAPHHDIYSIEDLRQLIYALKEATDYAKPVGVKIAAVHNVAPIASGIARAGADYIAIDGLRGGTGAAPTIIRNNVGIPIELAIAAVDTRLREEGIRNQVSVLAALVALGCHLCQKCYTGKCNWGIATQDPYLTKRLNPNIGSRRLANLIRAWSLEIKEMLGGMGVNAIESLRGNRDHLRGVGLNDVELRSLGVKAAGEA
jgi:glutamate synthase domain-containing protein 2